MAIANTRISALRERIHELKTTPGGSLAAMAGMAAAGTAGVAAALHFVRGRARSTFDVAPESDGKWALLANGSDEPVQKFSRKKRAVKVARTMAVDAAPSDLVIRDGDGKVQASHSYDKV